MDVTDGDITTSDDSNQTTEKTDNLTTKYQENGNEVEMDETKSELVNATNDCPQPSTSVSSDPIEANEDVSDAKAQSKSNVAFPKLKTCVKNRQFRKKNVMDDDLSSDDSLSENELESRPRRSCIIIDTTKKNDARPSATDGDNASSASRERLSSNNSDDSSDGIITETELDESTVESLDNTDTYEKICNPKIPPNWFAVREILKRQQGYSAKLNGHVQFQRRYYGSLHVAQRLELMSMMEYHDGCVNALGFNPTGSLIASASDDLRVVIWDWAIGKRKTSWVTKHKSNVFQSKFLALSGQSELHLVTSARDGQVWMWQLGQDGLRGSRKLGHHRGASHKLALLQDQPHVVLSCGEDALVYSHDVRDTKPNKLTYAVNKDHQRIPLYSIHSHPLNSSEFCVSGHDPAVGVYDQRFLNKDGLAMKCFEVTEKKMPDRHITASVYNYCGSEILASYNDDDIYLFDSSKPGNQYIHCYQGHRNGATIKGVNFFGPRSEYVISGSDCGNIFFWDKTSQGIVQFLLADKGVVNCLEPHPSMPILASSGLDPDVKVWIPSREEPNKMDGLLKTVTGNIRIRNMNGHQVRGDNRMIWMLWRVMQRSQNLTPSRRRSESHNSDERGDDDGTPNDASEDSSDTGTSDSDHDDDERDGNVECLPS